MFFSFDLISIRQQGLSVDFESKKLVITIKQLIKLQLEIMDFVSVSVIVLTIEIQDDVLL